MNYLRVRGLEPLHRELVRLLLRLRHRLNLSGEGEEGRGGDEGLKGFGIDV